MENEKLTICFFGDANSIHTLKWIKYFSAQKHRVFLISYSSPSESYKFNNIKFYLLKKKLPLEIWPFNTIINLPFILRHVKSLIKEINPDIIHAHCVTSYGTLSSLLGFHPLVITAWGSDIIINSNKNLAAKLITKYAFKKSDLITCDAEHMREKMVELGTSVSKIKLINFGIDTKQFSPGEKNEKLKEEFGFSDCQIVISLRSLEPLYNIETLIKAIPLIIKEFPETKFVIAGKGSQEENLKRLTENLGIIENIRFIGQIFNEELPKYLRMADVYVSTSLSDGGIASSTAEAMACGLAVVITDTGDNKHWVKDNENGFLIPTKNPEMLAEKVIYLLKNKEICSKFGEVNRKIIEEKNSYYKEMGKMENIYKELAKNNQKSI